VCSVLYAVCSVQCAVCSVQCTVCSVQCAVCSVQCAVCSVQCAVCSIVVLQLGVCVVYKIPESLIACLLGLVPVFVGAGDRSSRVPLSFGRYRASRVPLCAVDRHLGPVDPVGFALVPLVP
jgi:hypothetical protein